MGTDPRKIREIARDLRKRLTPAEKLLWEELRNRELGGLRFPRQHPIGRYIVDFYCAEHRLIIELEGSVHDDREQKSYDDGRFAEIQKRDLRVLRVKNDAVSEDVKGVLEKILSFKRQSLLE